MRAQEPELEPVRAPGLERALELELVRAPGPVRVLEPVRAPEQGQGQGQGLEPAPERAPGLDQAHQPLCWAAWLRSGTRRWWYQCYRRRHRNPQRLRSDS